MLAYSGTPRSKNFPCISYENCENCGVQYYVGRRDDTLLIAFRGTDSLKDLTVDMRFWKMRPPYGNALSKIRVHSGFITAYTDKCVREKIHRFVTPAIENIYITGHSFGAALGVLCALDLQYNYPERAYEVAVFGCPRVGNRAFVKSYNKRVIKTIRFENGNDAITKLPPAIFGYRHVGFRLHVGSPRLFGVCNLRDHSCGRYYQSIWKRCC
jgi:predicted lipase